MYLEAQRTIYPQMVDRRTEELYERQKGSLYLIQYGPNLRKGSLIYMLFTFLISTPQSIQAADRRALQI